MCLEPDFKLWNSKKDKLKKDYGWKVFSVKPNADLCGEWLSVLVVRKQNVWLNSRNFSPFCKIKITNFKSRSYFLQLSYPAGWHIYLTKKGATKALKNAVCNIARIKKISKIGIVDYVIKKVEFKKILAVGKQFIPGGYHGYLAPTIVSQYIKIIEGGERNEKND